MKSSEIIAAVATAHNVSVSDIKGPRRWPKFVAARRDAASRLRKRGLSAGRIAILLNRDLSTVGAYIWPRVVERKMELRAARLLQIADHSSPKPGVAVSNLKDDWVKPRGCGIRLSAKEVRFLVKEFNLGTAARDVARELKCSTRVVTARFARLRAAAAESAASRKALPDRFYKSNFDVETAAAISVE